MPVQRFIDAISTGWVAALWGIAYYLYRISKGEHFNGNLFLIHAFLSFFIGWFVGEFIPEEIKYKYWIVAMAGFFALEIIKILEKKLPLLFDKYVDQWITK